MWPNQIAAYVVMEVAKKVALSIIGAFVVLIGLWYLIN